jgi:hypothetical protein
MMWIGCCARLSVYAQWRTSLWPRIASAMSACSSRVPGSFSLVPPPAMLAQLRLDYGAMAVMIFGDVPAFETVMDSIATMEATVNR